MAKYHINPATGEAGPCRASKGGCPFGTPEEHFDSIEAAREAFEKSMAVAEVPTLAKKTRRRVLSRGEFAANVDSISYDELEAFVSHSAENYAFVNQLIEERAPVTILEARRLDAMNPFRNKDSDCDKETFKELKANHELFRDRTAMLVEAHQQSPFHKPLYETIEPKKIGKVVLGTKFDSDTKEWLEARFNTIGGSDIGALAVYDFTPKDELTSYEARDLRRVEKSKLQLPSDEEVAKRHAWSRGDRTGALYRGNSWEDRIRDQAVVDNPHLRIYNAKEQYFRPDRPWQQLNFDGLTSDREDGEPNGILEIKTGGVEAKWADGVPLNYRAQVLYYLNATGFEKATVAACLNDGDFRYYTIHRDDPVAPGGTVGMEEYLQSRVIPWFEELKSKRAA